jgi:hypothetical protein
MRGRAHGEELGDAFDDPEQHGEKNIVHADLADD